MIEDSFDLLCSLKKAGFMRDLRDPLWWPNSGSYEVVIGAILTQQTKWEKVEKSLRNLKEAGVDSLDKIADLDSKTLAKLIKPSGFYNTKAKYLLGISRAIIKDFGDFENFSEEVSRDWLLSQKGLGKESADSILCYGCKRDVMVADAYSYRLLKELGFEYEEYDDIANWLKEGVARNLENVERLYEKEMSLNEIYALFHGEIVEYCKNNSKGKRVDITHLL